MNSKDCMADLNKVVNTARNLLNNNPEWQKRYKNYAEKIHKNLPKIRAIKRKFNEWGPLYLYMNVASAKATLKFSLRYLGQDIGVIKISKGQPLLTTKDKIKRDFGYKYEHKDIRWEQATQFRKHFSRPIKRSTVSGKSNEEHRIESLLLTEFSKTKGKDKLIKYIQPVKLANIARFQMPTPVSASKSKISYSGSSGGGIDILARIGTGRGVKLCVLEVKSKNNSNEPPIVVLKQGLAYAAFIRELLRSECGEQWWNIFGFKRNIPSELELYVACVMPHNKASDISLYGRSIKIEQDIIKLHYIFFTEEDNKIVEIKTSLKQCEV